LKIINNLFFSLYGEQDYENQKEISFFGPPHENTDTKSSKF